MKKIIFDRRFLIAASLCLALLLSSVDAFARGDDRARDNRGHSKKGRHEVVVVNHDRYYYREGRFFRPSWFGFKIAIGVPPVGIVVSYIPAGHRTIVVGGATYYYYDNVYYRASPGGYVVVPAPVVVSSPPPTLIQSKGADADTVTINVPNANGSFTPVTLIKQGNGYIGPQGEYYAGNPTVEQLRVLYGT